MPTPDQPSPAPALKEIFNEERFRSVTRELQTIDSAFDSEKFLELALAGLDDLTLMQRLRRMTECLHATLPPDYRAAAFGFSEFAVREFLRHGLGRTLGVMLEWSRDEDAHVRRLASEGCRPRLPWSLQLTGLISDPTPILPVLENLKSDPSLYVRKSVANHLNDITKTHPDLVLQLLRGWPLENPHTAWIARHSLRTLIKQGQPAALKLIGATGKAALAPPQISLHPSLLRLGDSFTLVVELESTALVAQRLVVDYAVHYVRKSGTVSAKVFKWKELTLPAGGSVQLTRHQAIRYLTTRVYYPGRHEIEVLINVEPRARTWFELQDP